MPFAWIALLAAASTAVPAPGQGSYYQVRGKKLFVEKLGTGTPILFLHGGMTNFDSTYRAQREVFARSHTVVGVDQAGHGHSPDAGGKLSYREMAEDTAQLLQQLRLGRVDIVGHSDGGNIALLVARDHPELVRKVVVSGANLRPNLSPEEIERRSRWTPEQKAEKVRALAARMPPWFRSDYERLSPDGPDHYLVMLAKSTELWLQPLMDVADLKKIRMPVLVMAGDHDLWRIEDTAEIFRGLPQGRLLILPKTSHATFDERPALVNLAIEEFLDEP
jgi:pimeloyl-ACP methyl ester carboxylesterase